MQLRHKDANGKIIITTLGSNPIVIGRDPHCDLVIEHEKVSRRHCEIRMWENDYVIKDLKSQNSTYVNNEPVNVTQLQPGDQIIVGPTTLFFEDKTPVGDTTAFREIEGAMQEGKGYGTILRKIVKDIDEEPPPNS